MTGLSAEDLARWKAMKEEERNRRCPHCGGKTHFMHVVFPKGKSPLGGVPATWVHLCNQCHFMAYLTGDPETDAQARNLLDYRSLTEDSGE